jgi:hypothetical protein
LAITHSPSARTSLANAILDDIDVGTAGLLEFQTSGSVEVATLTLTDPAGSVSGAVLTFSAITSDTNATGGVVSKFELQTSAGAAVVLGNVLTSGGDINLSSLTVGATDTVSMSSLTYTAPV